jgi:hypothetical protein
MLLGSKGSGIALLFPANGPKNITNSPVFNALFTRC